MERILRSSHNRQEAGEPEGQEQESGQLWALRQQKALSLSFLNTVPGMDVFFFHRWGTTFKIQILGEGIWLAWLGSCAQLLGKGRQDTVEVKGSWEEGMEAKWLHKKWQGQRMAGEWWAWGTHNPSLLTKVSLVDLRGWMKENDLPRSWGVLFGQRDILNHSYFNVSIFALFCFSKSRLNPKLYSYLTFYKYGVF